MGFVENRRILEKRSLDWNSKKPAFLLSRKCSNIGLPVDGCHLHRVKNFMGL